MPRVLVLTRNPQPYRELLEAAHLPDLELAPEPGPGCDVAFGEPDRIREALDSLPGLKWAQSIWAGVEPLLDPALRRDYTLTNARQVFGPLMSEYVFGYLLLHERKMLQRLESQRRHEWDRTPGSTLRGKTLGLLGVGSIGAHLAGTARHFEMRVHGFTRSNESCADVERYFHADLPSFAAGLDFLVCVLPNTDPTRHIVDAAALKALPPHALLVNIGRGSTVDETALAAALTAGELAGAVLDVFEQEPLPTDHFLWDTPNVFITSHTSGPSYPQDIVKVFVENYTRYIEGQPLKHVVEFERGY